MPTEETEELQEVDALLFEQQDEESNKRRNHRKEHLVMQMADEIWTRANQNLAAAKNYIAQVSQFRIDFLALHSQEDGQDGVRRLISKGFRTARNPGGFLVGKRKIYQQADGTPN